MKRLIFKITLSAAVAFLLLMGLEGWVDRVITARAFGAVTTSQAIRMTISPKYELAQPYHRYFDYVFERVSLPVVCAVTCNHEALKPISPSCMSDRGVQECTVYQCVFLSMKAKSYCQSTGTYGQYPCTHCRLDKSQSCTM